MTSNYHVKRNISLLNELTEFTGVGEATPRDLTHILFAHYSKILSDHESKQVFMKPSLGMALDKVQMSVNKMYDDILENDSKVYYALLGDLE